MLAITCSPPTWKWNRCRATNMPIGNWATATFTLRPIWTRCGRASWLDKTAIVICDVENEALHQPVCGRAAFDSAPPTGGRRRNWAISVNAASELEYYIYRDSYREAHEKRLCRISSQWAGIWKITIYYRARAKKVSLAPPVTTSSSSWHSGGEQQGRMGLGPTRDQYPLRRPADYG